MRGKLRRLHAATAITRITPADAGKTIDKDGVIVIGQDHPRGCGENGGKLYASNVTAGSPPRMRGKPETPAVPKS